VNRGGFTLLELTVSMTLAALVVLLGFSSLAQVRDAAATASAAEETHRAAAARYTLTAWLASARAGGEVDAAFTGVGRRDGSHAADELTFLASSALPYHAGATWVTLRLAAELRPGGDTASRRVPLVPARGLSIRYLFASGGESRWLDGFVSTVELPAAIEVVVQPSPGTPRLFRLPLLVPLGYRP
jgi:prepilin-type N-terminal cleavage/methylation domain-containing protein